MANDKQNTSPNVPNKREQSGIYSGYVERGELRPQGNVPNLRFPEFTEEWKTVFIGDILNIGNGKDYKLLNPGCIPVFGTGGYMLSVDNFLYDGESVLIGRKGTINKPFYYSGKFWTVDTLFYTHSFNEVLPKFVYGLFQNINWDLYNEASGVPSLSKSTIEKIRCNIPTIKEQSKIANLLFLFDRRIATQNKIIKQLQSLIKGIVVEHYNKSHKTKVKIKDLGKSYSVMNMSKEDLSETGNECIIYGELFTTYDCVATDVVSKTKKSIQSSTISTGYDLLFPASTTVDAQSLIAPTAISQPNIILGGDMFGIVVTNEYNNEYLSYIFNYIYKNYLAQYAQGSTIIHLHYNDIKNLDIELPDIKAQNELVLLLKNIKDKILTEKKMLSMLGTQKAYLLRNLFI